jgi:SAM-dependent methyltransferase
VNGKLRGRLGREIFRPSFLGALFHPSYIIRRGLYLTIRDLAPEISGDVLDFGCGSKPYASLFMQARSYIGVDLEKAGHDHSDSRIDVFYDGKVLPFADRQFNAVVSFEVFEHVFNLSEILVEIHRVTKDSGLLLISVPFAWEEHEIPYDFARYTSFGISHLLKQAGYEIVELRKTTTHVLAVFQLLIAYLSQGVPKFKLVAYLRQACIVFPCTMLALAADAILPKRYRYYCNTVLIARKISE